jgi:hypothetical protein
MPGKSRHKKSKHPHHSRKSKAILRQGILASQKTPADVPKPATPVAAPIAPKEATTLATAPAIARTPTYPYITTELRRIGILAGIILIILIVLSVILT